MEPTSWEQVPEYHENLPRLPIFLHEDSDWAITSTEQIHHGVLIMFQSPMRRIYTFVSMADGSEWLCERTGTIHTFRPGQIDIHTQVNILLCRYNETL